MTTPDIGQEEDGSAVALDHARDAKSSVEGSAGPIEVVAAKVAGQRAYIERHFPSKDAARMQSGISVGDVEGVVAIARDLRGALKRADLFVGIMLASPFWREAVDPVRSDVQRVHDDISAAIVRAGER